MPRLATVTLFVLLLLALDVLTFSAQVAPAPTSPADALTRASGYIRSDRLGVTFVNSAQAPPSDARYRNALVLGAGWTRWPLYWDQVEFAPGQYNWAAYDRLVADDLRHGLRINAILLNKPAFFSDDATQITNLYAPVFADGSDNPAPGKQLNPNNPWALFVFRAVERYKPGGVLARERGWGGGVRIWEVWNEPDYRPFWQGSIEDYARLLKVAYLAAHQADPNAVVMFGGLLYGTPQNWLSRVLNIYYNTDAQRAANNWYMDAVAIHSYSNPRRTGWLVQVAQQALSAYGISRPVWVNESGVSVWDEYPGPVWASAPGSQRVRRATSQQQAHYWVQSTAYAFAQGAERVFYHQLYDDCGDQPSGTDFPPHNGDLCGSLPICFGDGFGIFRNERGATCYGQHPRAGTARPVADAFRMVSETFGRYEFSGGTVSRTASVVTISFTLPAIGGRLHVVWNRSFSAASTSISATQGSAQLYSMQGVRGIAAQNGQYTLNLPAAQPDYHPDLEGGDVTAIGGPPMIILEAPAGPAPTFAQQSTNPNPPANQSQPAPPTPIPTETPIPVYPTTVPFAPAAGPLLENPQGPFVDETPPVATVADLPALSPASFTVRWQGRDDGQIDRYLIWVRIDGGQWSPWMETQRSEAVYTGESGRLYAFAAWAVDTAGNWSENVALTPQASTRVQ